MPYAVATSDVARMGLLAEHGGLYMDADFLVARPLAPLARMLENHDVVSYASVPIRSTPTLDADSLCKRGFAPNLVLARPHDIRRVLAR